MNLPKIQIAVVGAGQCSEVVARQAEEVGRAVARAGAVLVCGGLGGVMEAAARGARLEGGFTLGVLPGVGKETANAFIDCAVATGLGHFRNFLIAQTADALVAVAGKHGTLSEIAMALNLGKTVVCLGSWNIEGVVHASSPHQAVELAMAAAR
ncbi:MAG TPA: TIGR00725 family protein [Vicinamibacteria bacterium]|nr:TIGR00725 family protein [Vicinamibacteria bacterium]